MGAWAETQASILRWSWRPCLYWKTGKKKWSDSSPKGLPILTVYGSDLAALRTPRASIDEQLQKEGLVKFLKPGWRGKAKIVLTTYETLRDLEFSFAAEKWSVMVCDEAQKIKNPTRCSPAQRRSKTFGSKSLARARRWRTHCPTCGACLISCSQVCLAR